MIITKEVKEKLYEGMEILSNIVCKTLGPNGQNVVLYDYALNISSDGYTIAKEVVPDDPVHKIGCELLVSASEMTKQEVGDGTTSTIVLGCEMVKKVLPLEINLITINKELTIIEKRIFDEIDNFSFKIETIDDLYKVAYTSSNDQEISQIVSKVVHEVGAFGTISTVPNYSLQIEYDINHGYVYERGFISTYLVENGTIHLNNAFVVIVNDVINTINELENILYEVKKTKHDFLLIATGYSKEVVDYIVYLKNSYRLCATLSPEFGDNAKDIMEDIALYLNTSIITKKTVNLTSITLGKADTIDVYENITIIKKSDYDEEMVNKKVNYLHDINKYKRDQLIQKRIASLSSKIAYIKLPQMNEYEYKLRKEKCINAINSCMEALKTGGTHGGGETLYQISFLNTSSELEKAIFQSLSIIKRCIKVEDIGNNNNVIDASQNIKSIIKNSLNVLKLFLSLETVIINPKSYQKKDQYDFNLDI